MSDAKSRRTIPLLALIVAPTVLSFLLAVGSVVLTSVRAGENLWRDIAVELTWKTAGEIDSRLAGYFATARSVLSGLRVAVESGGTDMEDTSSIQTLLHGFAGITPAASTLYYSDHTELT
ncbi:MAG TPA: hypothetical protein VLH39_05145, partial [Magnetospirillaceae bacterium]|nr:hypothetical protein [Magnetospirillaceae bacterium]